MAEPPRDLRSSSSVHQGGIDMASVQSKAMPPLPSFLTKYLKVKPAAVDSTDGGRLCELDPNDDIRVLVWSNCHTDKWSDRDGFNEMNWSQKRLWEAARHDRHIRIARKELAGMKLEIFRRDLYNPSDYERIKDLPNMEDRLVDVKLGFAQARDHTYIYLLSTPDER